MRVHAVMITYRRPDALRSTLSVLSHQTRQPDTMVIVDNDPLGSSSVVAVWPGAVYVSCGDNLGPAGGLDRGIEAVRELATSDDWLLVLDDDDPPTSATAIEQLAAFAEALPLDVAATGLVGGRYDRRTGQTARVSDAELNGPVEVDWIGGGQLPLYRLSALLSVRPNSSLFFGYEELDLGLRLKGAGWRLIVDGDRWRSLRAMRDRLQLSKESIRERAPDSAWRRYYGTRNLVIIARMHGAKTTTIASVVSLGRIARLLTTAPRTSCMALRGLLDGLLGRTGRRVDPPRP